MKKTIFTISLCLSIVSASAAEARNLMETTEDARLRQNSERYEQYQQNNYQAPLGGYKEKLGDSAPYGTNRPGYTSGSTYGNTNTNTNDNRNSLLGY